MQVFSARLVEAANSLPCIQVHQCMEAQSLPSSSLPKPFQGVHIVRHQQRAFSMAARCMMLHGKLGQLQGWHPTYVAIVHLLLLVSIHSILYIPAP